VDVNEQLAAVEEQIEPGTQHSMGLKTTTFSPRSMKPVQSKDQSAELSTLNSDDRQLDSMRNQIKQEVRDAKNKKQSNQGKDMEIKCY